MERLTISLDDALRESLESLQARSGESKAALVRRALREYVRRHRRGTRPTEFDLRVWTDLLSNREHVILDVAHLRLLLAEAEDAPEAFWEDLRRSGEEHGRQYRDKGFTGVGEALEFFEAANWWHLAHENERSWSLVLLVPESKPFIAAFLRGFFEPFPVQVEVLEELAKIRVRIAQEHPLGGSAARSAGAVR